MWRFLTGAAAMLVLVAAGFFLSRQMAESAVPLPAPPVGTAGADAPAVSSAPVADPAIREARRFARYDKNKDGLVGTEEYLVTRQKAFARIDTNRDGVIFCRIFGKGHREISQGGPEPFRWPRHQRVCDDQSCA